MRSIAYREEELLHQAQAKDANPTHKKWQAAAAKTKKARKIFVQTTFDTVLIPARLA